MATLAAKLNLMTGTYNTQTASRPLQVVATD